MVAVNDHARRVGPQSANPKAVQPAVLLGCSTQGEKKKKTGNKGCITRVQSDLNAQVSCGEIGLLCDLGADRNAWDQGKPGSLKGLELSWVELCWSSKSVASVPSTALASLGTLNC